MIHSSLNKQTKFYFNSHIFFFFCVVVTAIVDKTTLKAVAMSDTSCKLGVSEGIPCPSPSFLREQKRSVVNHKHAFIHSEFHGELRSPDNRATCSGE